MNESINAFTAEEIVKLPKWAQEKIKDLTRERNQAVRDLNKWIDCQTPSPITVDEHPCIGENCGPSFKTRYIQATDVNFTWKGVELSVSLRDGHGHDAGISLQWSGPNHAMNHVAMIPLSYNRVQLLSKENMR